ncbi:hypothetical protein HELRODRAFT_174026 [Helobdella robusta]|uniref:Fucolectin tachylectin-4 pentraxin-1 domain-containing protein n=1 Tax=Helobdella robusta TaxID=6412 RepID=T1F7I0_HELRO|nr:hypothetical protein HELRODRAFT_174026 [Helobdella robusta]ESO03134.1 hypothetical protein HELRODRAFT_174026 [Helobdella robusta]
MSEKVCIQFYWKTVLVLNLLVVRHVLLAQNLALNKPTINSSVYPYYFSPSSNLLVDGDSNPEFENRHCFSTGDGPGGPNWAVIDLFNQYHADYANLFSRGYCCTDRMDYFLIGLTSVDYFPFGSASNIVRGDYPLCGQYEYKSVTAAWHKLKCNANLISAYRYVILQQPSTGPGLLTVCEMEIYAALNINCKYF